MERDGPEWNVLWGRSAGTKLVTGTEGGKP